MYIYCEKCQASENGEIEILINFIQKLDSIHIKKVNIFNILNSEFPNFGNPVNFYFLKKFSILKIEFLKKHIFKSGFWIYTNMKN